MANLYELRSKGALAFIVAALALVGVFLYISQRIVNSLAEEERERMEVWADATKAIVNLDNSETGGNTADIDLLLRIIRGNTQIPVLLIDDAENLLQHRNFDLPEPVDSLNPLYISPVNEEYLRRQLRRLQGTRRVIVIDITPEITQRLYYDESRLLSMLGYYPYVQVLVLAVFIGVGYFAVVSGKRAEQNKVWVGLSKETAHQLGTPISSLMAWMDLLRDSGTDPDIVAEMDKDVRRLSTVASRFGKIGSRPTLEPTDLNRVVAESVAYMATRISRRITLRAELSPGPLTVALTDSLFQWVLENLIKNSVDAMYAEGTITIVTRSERDMAVITVTDTGKGLQRKHFTTIFKPGYTTKKRGWGLGLALAKRIVEQYHRGRIFVASSEPGRGTTIAIHLPLYHQ